jgi:hypothetical protein
MVYFVIVSDVPSDARAQLKGQTSPVFASESHCLLLSLLQVHLNILFMSTIEGDRCPYIS